MQQYFIEEKVDIQKNVYFTKEQEHHIKKVMRTKENTCIKVVDAEGCSFLAHIKYEDNRVSAACFEALASIVQTPRITLVQGMIKKDKWDFLLQKTSELGVDEIIPMISSRSIAKVNEDDVSKLERYNRITREACEQCKRDSVVRVLSPITFQNIKNNKRELNIIAYEEADCASQSLKDVLRQHSEVESILYVVGSEGGFSSAEVDALVNEGFVCVSLGTRILRAETAALSLVNITRYEFE